MLYSIWWNNTVAPGTNKRIRNQEEMFQSAVRSVTCYSVTPLTIAHQTSLPLEFSRQKYSSSLPFPSPGGLPDPGIKPTSPIYYRKTLPLHHIGNIYGQKTCTDKMPNRKFRGSYKFLISWLREQQNNSTWFILIHLPRWNTFENIPWRTKGAIIPKTRNNVPLSTRAREEFY